MVATRYGLIRDFPSSVWFLTIYSAIVGLVIGFWLLLPSLALVLFLLISSLHFGRDWKYKISFGGFGYAPSCLACLPGHSPSKLNKSLGSLFLKIQRNTNNSNANLGLIGGFMLLADRKKLSILRLAEFPR